MNIYFEKNNKGMGVINMDELYSGKLDEVENKYKLSKNLFVGGIAVFAFGVIFLLIYSFGLTIASYPVENIIVASSWFGGAFAVWYSFKMKIKAKQAYANEYFQSELIKKYPKSEYIAFAKSETDRENIKKKFKALGVSEIIDCNTTLTNVFISNARNNLVYYSRSEYERDMPDIDGNRSGRTTNHTELQFLISANISKGYSASFYCNNGMLGSNTEGLTVDCLSSESKERLMQIYNDFGNYGIGITPGKAYVSFDGLYRITSCPESIDKFNQIDAKRESANQISKLYRMLDAIEYVVHNTTFEFNIQTGIGDGKYMFKEASLK